MNSHYLTGKVEGKRVRRRPKINFVGGMARRSGGGMSETEMLPLTRCLAHVRKRTKENVTVVGERKFSLLNSYLRVIFLEYY